MSALRKNRRGTGRAFAVNAAVGGLILVVFVAVVFYAHGAVSRDLARSAVAVAERWYDATLNHPGKVEDLLQGVAVSEDGQQRLEAATSVGKVRDYVIFAADGTPGLWSDPMFGPGNPTFEKAVNTAADVITTKSPATYATESSGGIQFANAFLPVWDGSAFVGVLKVTMDQTEEHATAMEHFYAMVVPSGFVTVLALAGSVVLGLLLNAQRRRDAMIRHLARHDVLTGAANRAEFSQILEAAMDEANPGEPGIALHMIDLDRFKAVNDVLGHATGDALLRAVTKALQKCVGRRDLVARLGGDEFAVIQRGIQTEEEAVALARRVTKAVRAIDTLKGTPVSVSVSMGIATSRDTHDPEKIQHLADAALYGAKEGGRDQFVLFQTGMDEVVRQRSMLRSMVRHALNNESYELFYQPLHGTSDGTIKAFEALLRLPNGLGGYISPSEFVPIAEEMGVTPELGAWVLTEATKTAVTWDADINVSVNLSPQQFQADVVTAVRSALKESGLPARRLELEITENLFIANPESVEGQLRTLKEMGVKIVMDDFGTGYSSFQHLWKFPFDKLKVDRSCFSSVEESNRVREILKTISAMSDAMALAVTAEGVESEAQKQFALDAGYDEIQGFLYSRPMPANMVAAYVRMNQNRLGDASAKKALPVPDAIRATAA